MTRILEILAEFVKEIEKDNPYGLVMKGGTALSLFYLNHHRESEDLDFDAEKSYAKEYKKIEAYFRNILEKLKKNNVCKSFSIGKSGLAATNRYHMKLQIETYKSFDTKIDVDFVELPSKLVERGKLFLYSPERLFIAKMAAFINRREFKDLYDIINLISCIDIDTFKHNQNVVQLLDKGIDIIMNENIAKLFKNAFRNVDLGFKDVKASEVDRFTVKALRSLRIVKNKIE
jgi:predicted nucleotidyltransferase component of viral defense system